MGMNYHIFWCNLVPVALYSLNVNIVLLVPGSVCVQSRIDLFKLNCSDINWSVLNYLYQMWMKGHNSIAWNYSKVQITDLFSSINSFRFNSYLC